MHSLLHGLYMFLLIAELSVMTALALLRRLLVVSRVVTLVAIIVFTVGRAD
jgi:hypothetical protein